MTMFTLYLPLAVFSFSGDNYFALFSSMYSFFPENKTANNREGGTGNGNGESLKWGIFKSGNL